TTAAFIFLFIAAAVTAQAQEKEIEKITKFIKKKRINAAYIMGGINTFDLLNLNNYLEKRDYPIVSKQYFSFGLGGHVIHNKFILGIEIKKFLEIRKITAQQFTTFLSGKYSLLNTGYLMYSKKGLMMYPLFGVGVGEMKLKVIEKNIKSFNDINSYHRYNSARTHSFLVNLGFGMDYFFNFDKKKKGKNNLMFGLRAGYLISAIKFEWKVNHILVADGPRIGLTGPYIHLAIGLGGWVEKLIEKAI
ncbi:MAG: hypothetical protein GY950_16910, partial [bacterium]|nr:hypothetical protein [bacterium]